MGSAMLRLPRHGAYDDSNVLSHRARARVSDEHFTCCFLIMCSRSRCGTCRLSVIRGTCLSSVACRFQTLLTWLSIIYTVVVATSMIAVVLVLIDSLKPHQLSFASGQQSPWELALTMSMDVGLHHKQRNGLVNAEYGTKQRPSKFAADMYSKDNGDPPPVSKRTLGI